MRIVEVTGGVDTHADNHMAAAVDHNGGLLGIESFPATESGYEDLLGWLVGFGELVRIGVEGTGSWGVGLTRFMTSVEVEVIEVDRPNRQKRRKHGKSDPTDAMSAARALFLGRRRSHRRVGMVGLRRCGSCWLPVGLLVNRGSSPSTSCDISSSVLPNRSGIVSRTGPKQGWSGRQQTCSLTRVPTPSSIGRIW